MAYDGSGFHGWATQQELRTVQFEVENTIGALIHELDLPTVCAGRTDAGVHARGQVIHFDLPRDHSELGQLTPERINKALPEDIKVVTVEEAPHGFDARFSAIWREYSYTVCDSPLGPTPLRRHDVLPWPVALDLDRLNAASASLIGTHDFFAFCKEKPFATTIRDVLGLSWTRDHEGYVVMTIRADAFCHSMVRSVVGALLPIGDGRKAVTWTQELLDQEHKTSHVQVMEPWALVLEKVGYPEDSLLLARQSETRNKRDGS
ncbi:MAG: tRNA pseudouridine(38-40) synthase TruA [Candidatus Nanopelagicales bacterium]|nr:tRNA pseudouridine(38-40) synthase TruA [Candidatus Nanopelagicales bacterium]